MAFAIANCITNTNSVKTKTSAINGGLDKICVCDVGQLRKRPISDDHLKCYLLKKFYMNILYQPHISRIASAIISAFFSRFSTVTNSSGECIRPSSPGNSAPKATPPSISCTYVPPPMAIHRPLHAHKPSGETSQTGFQHRCSAALHPRRNL